MKTAVHSVTFLLFLFTALIVIAAAIVYAPTYLAYSDLPVKADVVFVFPGADSQARHEEATKLIEAGFAERLIIAGRVGDKTRNANQATPFYPRYYENTHIQVLDAKKEMDLSGFSKAIFVSSPCHMRRLRIISAHVFRDPDHSGNSYKITFVPVRSEESPSLSWLIDARRLHQMALEYTKMAWFCVYKNT